MSSYITTYTRKHFDPVHPDPERIVIEDIAHALSLLCRGNGHVTTFWSVGQHCICCAKEAAGRGLSDRIVLAVFFMMPVNVTCLMCHVLLSRRCRSISVRKRHF